MTFRINEHMTALLRLDGKEVPFDVGNLLHKLHIVGGSGLTLPAIHMEFTDSLNILAELRLQDASQIEITLNGTTSITRKFRVAKWTRPPAQAGFTYAIDGYWDSPRYWLGTADRALTGASSDVVKQIADECGLGKYSQNVKTADAQRWVPRNQTWGNFAHSISQSGYVSDSSYTALAVDSEGLLRYLDLNSLPKTDLVLTSTPQQQGNALLISDFLPTTQAGLNNAVGGYRYDRVLQSILPMDTTVETSVSVMSDSKAPLINAAARDIQKTGRVLYGPIDGGNVHNKFQRALYQNTRFNLLYSVGGEFLTAAQTRLEFGDSFRYVSPAAVSNRTYDGKFTVSKKVIFVIGSLYMEKFIAYRHGVDA